MDHAQHSLRHPLGGVCCDQLAAELPGPGPLAAFAQHVHQAGHAGLGGPVAVGPAQPEGGIEGLLGAAVVRRVVENHSEPLIELRGDRGEVMLQRQCQDPADGLEALLEVAPLRAPRPRAERSRAGPGARPRWPPGGRPCQLEGVAVLRADPPVVGHREAFDGGVRRPAARGEGLDREAPGGKRGLALSAELVDGRACCASAKARLAACAPDGGQLAPALDRLGQLAGQLGTARIALEDLASLTGILVIAPQLECLAPRAGGIAVRVDGLGLAGSLHEQPPGSPGLACPQPV